jgi:hypothetical protein
MKKEQKNTLIRALKFLTRALAQAVMDATIHWIMRSFGSP